MNSDAPIFPAIGRPHGELLAEALDGVSDGVMLFDADDRLVYSNRLFRERLTAAGVALEAGMPFEEICRNLTRRVPSIMQGEEPESWIEMRMARHRNPGEPFEVPIGDGWILVQENRTPDGGTLCVYTFITALKQAAEALKESESRYRSLSDLSPDVIMVLRDGIVEFANPAAAKLFGADVDESLIGRSVFQFVHPDSQPELARRRARLAKGGGPLGMSEIKYVRHDGTEFEMENWAAHIQWEGRAATLLIGRDITDRKRAEEALRRAVEEAEKANLAKSRFLTATGHDLRQPLQALILMNSALANQAWGPEARALIGNMRHAIDAIKSAMDGLLDIGRLEAGVVTPEIAAIPVSAIFERMMGEFSIQADEKGLRLRVVPTGARVLSDGDLLARILQNLISNAIRNTASGSVLIGCRRRGGTLSIEVWDTGVGIPESDRHRVFDEFFQVENLANPTKGLGLGLAIVDRTAGLLGHAVELDSVVGRGSVFRILAPSADDEAGAGGPQPDGGRIAGIAGARVLLIDGDARSGAATRDLLEGWGARVSWVEACGDAERRDVLGGERPDLIIGPDDDAGIALARRPSVPGGRRVPILLITDGGAPGVRRDPDGARCHVLPRPLDPAKLYALLRHLLSGSA